MESRDGEMKRQEEGTREGEGGKRGRIIKETERKSSENWKEERRDRET